MVGIGFLLGGYIVGQNDVIDSSEKTELIDNKQKEQISIGKLEANDEGEKFDIFENMNLAG